MLTGKAIVWVLLDSGDGQKDQAAAEVLGTALGATEGQPLVDRGSNGRSQAPNELTEASYSTDMLTFSPPDLRLLRVSRSDPAEQVFAAMLLNCAPHLPDRTDQPMAFPVFGRGRVLDVLVGQEIDEEVIDAVNAFLCSPCSCMVKVQGPGLDLLMAVDWEAAVAEVGSESRVVLPLAGDFALPAGNEPAPRATDGTAHWADGSGDSLSAGSLTRNMVLALEARPKSPFHV